MRLYIIPIVIGKAAWSHWMNNFTAKAQGRNAVAAVNSHNPRNPPFVVPQTCCLPVAGAINAARGPILKKP